ncbi:MAG: ribonuclease III [Eubacterium sp.]|nr:ribonuclease III [Eubacterium sp.]
MNKHNQELFLSNIGYTFSNNSLFENAITHSSYAHEQNLPYEKNNERLEYLGDAVLELVTSRYIFENYPEMVEGSMTTLRASLVCEMSLAAAAREINLGDILILGHGEEKTGGRERDSVLSDAFEAVIGAIYLDGGLNEAERFIKIYLLTDIESKQLYYDAKSKLQEMIQDCFHEHTDISYAVLDESGPAHKKNFVVSCRIQGREISTGSGQNKKKAEQDAAYHALLELRNKDVLSYF